MLKYHIQTVDVGAASSSTITFANIPQIYDDLLIEISPRSTSAPAGTAIADGYIYFNGSTTGYSGRLLYGQGSGSGATGSYSNIYWWYPSSSATANTFGSTSVYIPSYTSSLAKITAQEIYTENDATFAYNMLFSGKWTGTSAINSIALQMNSTNFAQYSSASLYGIKRGADGVTLPVASGGTVTTSGGYTYHTFSASSTFVATKTLDLDVLVVAGGGSGGATQTSSQRGSGGGGAGGYLSQSLTVSSGSYSIVVGAGGAGVAALRGLNGANSSAFSLVAVGGGGGGGGPDSTTIRGLAGASGGGGYSENSGIATGGSGIIGQGNSGGTGNYVSSSNFFGGGGGGAGEAGNTDESGDGGDGLQWLNGSYYSGGGAGATYTNYSATGGLGGGANGPRGTGAVSGNAGTSNTGGGGSGALSVSEATSQTGGNGGSGIVIIRYPTPA